MAGVCTQCHIYYKYNVSSGRWGHPYPYTLTGVVLAKELHAHDGKDENDDAQDKGQVTQGTHGFTHDGNE